MKYVKGTEIREDGDMATAIIHLTERMEVLSSAILNGGHNVTDTLFIMQVPHMYRCDDLYADILEVREKYGLPKDATGFMTAAEVKYLFSTAETNFEGAITFAAVTAGLSNHVVAGETLENWDERFRISQERYRMLIAGTINIIGISPEPLNDVAKINILMPITEAKTVALNSLGYKETGTTSDAVAIVSPIGENRLTYAGTGVPLGISMARSVKDAVVSNLVKRKDFPYMGDIVYQLGKKGITRDMMWEAVMEIQSSKSEQDNFKLKKLFDKKLDDCCKDVNISSLVQGAILLDELGEKDCICAMQRGTFLENPGNLNVNEMLGMQLAQYISGTEGISEFHRFHENKPNFIKELEPFMENMMCGLIGGIISLARIRMFDKNV